MEWPWTEDFGLPRLPGLVDNGTANDHVAMESDDASSMPARTEWTYDNPFSVGKPVGTAREMGICFPVPEPEAFFPPIMFWRSCENAT